MTLHLNQGTTPDNLAVKTQPRLIDSDVRIGEYSVSAADFCAMVEYVLTNTDLEDEDPRTVLVERIRGATRVSGHNNGGERLLLSA
ncbi:MAG: hypothetical protein JWL75_284 [Parcubacteria group bacterium]|nr:hypothetical protein [Parcubacteria group bacterium]